MLQSLQFAIQGQIRNIDDRDQPRRNNNTKICPEFAPPTEWWTHSGYEAVESSPPVCAKHDINSINFYQHFSLSRCCTSHTSDRTESDSLRTITAALPPCFPDSSKFIQIGWMFRFWDRIWSDRELPDISEHVSKKANDCSWMLFDFEIV